MRFFDKSVRLVCGWARRWNDLYWFVACLWLVSLVWGVGVYFCRRILTCADLDTNGKENALPITQSSSSFYVGYGVE